MAAIDLTTLANVQAYLGLPSGPADAILASMITGASQYWLTRTGRDSLNSVASYSKRYDGSGSRRQFLRNSPITAVSLLQVGSVVIPPSTDYISPGYVIDQSGKSIAIIAVGPTGLFWRGIQNVLVQYSAGYSAVPADVQDKVTQMVAVNYKRKSWIDQASQQLAAGAGTVTYRGWEIPPEVERVIQAYSRSAIV